MVLCCGRHQGKLDEYQSRCQCRPIPFKFWNLLQTISSEPIRMYVLRSLLERRQTDRSLQLDGVMFSRGVQYEFDFCKHETIGLDGKSYIMIWWFLEANFGLSAVLNGLNTNHTSVVDDNLVSTLLYCARSRCFYELVCTCYNRMVSWFNLAVCSLCHGFVR